MATVMLLIVFVVMCVLMGAWMWRLGRQDQCRDDVERAVSACFASAEWRGRIGLSVRPRIVLTGAHVRLSVMASSDHELVEALVAVMHRLPREVQVTLDGTVGHKRPQRVHVIARGMARDGVV